MQEEKDKKPAKSRRMNKYARFYTIVGVASLILAGAIIGTATAIGNNSSTTVDKPQEEQPLPDDETKTEETMSMPVLQVTLTGEHGFYYNQTLGFYGHHDGVDFAAEVGAEVFCVLDGVVESVYKADLLCGTEIVVDHGDGLKTTYRYVTESEGLKAGDKVKKGQKIATVAEPSGAEYKDGAHLHFEVTKEGTAVDPAGYLPLGEK